MENDEDTPSLMGYLLLEALDFVPDPKNQTLMGNPEHGGEWIVDLDRPWRHRYVWGSSGLRSTVAPNHTWSVWPTGQCPSHSRTAPAMSTEGSGSGRMAIRWFAR